MPQTPAGEQTEKEAFYRLDGGKTDGCCSPSMQLRVQIFYSTFFKTTAFRCTEGAVYVYSYGEISGSGVWKTFLNTEAEVL